VRLPGIGADRARPGRLRWAVAGICAAGLLAALVGGLLAWRYHGELARDRAALVRDQAPPKVLVRSRRADLAAPVLSSACREAVVGGLTLSISVTAARLADGAARVLISGRLRGARPGDRYGLLADIDSPTQPEQLVLSHGRAGRTGMVVFSRHGLTTGVKDWWVLQPYRDGPGAPAVRALVEGRFARAQLTSIPPGGPACRP
jgi:hypothetical protein